MFCYPHLFRCFHNYSLLQLSLKTLCCLAFSRLLCSVFKVQAPTPFEVRSQSTIRHALRSNIKLELVGPSGLEPPTLRLSVVRSSQLSYGPVVGVDFISLVAAPALQLAHSVTPPLRVTNTSLVCSARGKTVFLVEIVGFEPATSCLQGRRSPS